MPRCTSSRVRISSSGSEVSGLPCKYSRGVIFSAPSKTHLPPERSASFDTKTSSWIKTPPAIRKLGGALFCDFRYGRVFVYHNGAESYYAARGFRGSLKV